MAVPVGTVIHQAAFRCSLQHEGPRGPRDLADDLGVGRPGPTWPRVLVWVVANELPRPGTIVLSKNPIDAVRRADSTLDAHRVATFVTAESLC